MKLSQKLLALGGVTLADYACCPYDDYGMPHDLCTNALPEKTPFSLESDWRNGACKAWESNVDATYDGNDQSCGTNENWGSCGFQRHFPWNQVNTEDKRNRGCEVLLDTGTGSRSHNDGCHCQGFGDAVTTAIVCKTDGSVTDCTTDDSAYLAAQFTTPCYETDFLGRRNIQANKLHLDSALTYSSASSGSLGFSYVADADLSTGSDSNSKLYNLAGVPFLGGVCKLFVPVPRTRITSVQIAGVHVSLEGAGSVFSAKVADENDGAHSQNDHVGTAYCFSVVNPAEALKNSNGIHNGNVAGGALGTSTDFEAMVMKDPMTSLERQAGIEPKFNFFDGSDDQNIGDQLINFNASGNNNSAEKGEADSEVGANFDVVVHIHSEWCNSPSFWTVADMQLLGDYNNGNQDYPLNSQPFTAQASRTDLLYSDAQIDPLPIKTAFDLIGTKNTEQTASETDFTSTTNADACYLAASSCSAQMDTYFEKAKLAATCAANLLTQADCGDEDTEETDAQAAYYTCLSGLLPGIAGDCTDDTDHFDEIEELAVLSQAWGTDVGEYINAVNAYNDDLANSFTHAHTDLMDKRHDEVASYNNVYQQDGNGYLQFPNSNDDAFKDKDGNPDANLYTASASYLRWPNAGAFAAFYSFVACANPPHISGNAAVKADVNYYSIIYNNGVDPDAVGDPTSAETAYSYLGETILRSRTLVMSQSDSDYRDESCQNREFRANVRQVGNSVTHCGPGQLPDTDNKRCSWNWNYNSHSFTGDNDTHNGKTTGDGGIVWKAPSAQNPLDAEEWFDRNDPHSFDMWSTRKRRAVANDRKYAFNMGYWGAQEGATGDGSNMFNGQVFDSENQFHANAIQIPITDFNFNLIFKNADDEVPPMTVEINTDFCFSPSNAAGCTACVPSAAEFNQAGFVDVNGEAVTISADTYAADVAALSGLYHETACGGSDHTVGATTYKTCTPAEISLMQATTHLGSTTVCDSNNGNSYKAENGKGGFRQLTNAQTLTFDDPRIKSALNPTSKKWEVSVQCEKVNMQTLSNTQAQRDYFPECFFGDEIWFTFTYGSDLVGAYPASPAISTPHNLSYNTYVSAWFSSVEVQTTPEYISASQLLSAN